MTTQLLSHLLQRAMASARSQSDPELAAGPLHADRSRRFVEAFAAALREHYKADRYVVFSKYCPDHRGAFKLNELLYDVHICETACVPDTDLCFIKRSILQVESELARDTREALIDFSKLVVGAAEFKLFIGPLVHESKRKGYLDALAIAARGCSGATFVAHPAAWAGDAHSVEVFKFEGGTWVAA